MTTLVDALVLTIGLDPSGFQKGAKDTEAALKKTRETAVSHGKGIEQSMKAASDGVNKLTLRFLELYAVLTGGHEIKQFIADTTRNDAAIGRFANNLQMSAKDLGAWQGIVENVGGTAADATSSIQAFSNQIQAIKAGHADRNFLLSLGQIGGKPINFNAPIDQSYKTLGDNLRALYKRDPQFANYLAQQVGMSQNMFNALVMEKGALEKLRAAERKYAPTDADIKAATDRQGAWQLLIKASEQLGRSIETQLTPVFLRLSTAIQEFIDKHGDQIRAFFQRIADAIQNAPWARWFEDLKTFAKGVDEVAKSLGGWKAVLEAVVAIKVLSVVTSLATQFGLMAAAIARIVGAGPSLTALFAAGGPLAALGALLATLYPQRLNAGEDERARQERLGLIPPGARQGPSGVSPATGTAPGSTPARGIHGGPSTGTAGVPGGGARGGGPGGGRTPTTGGGGATPANVTVPGGAAALGLGIAHDVNFSHQAAYRHFNPFNVNLTTYGRSLGGTSAPLPDQPGHAQFPTMEAGFRAGLEALRNRYNRGDKTLNDLFTHPGRQWSTAPGAPGAISRQLGIGQNQDLGLNDPAQLDRMGRALIQQETGNRALSQRILDEIGQPSGAVPAPPPRPQSFLLPPNIGAATAANVANNTSTVNSHNTSSSQHEVHVANVNIQTAATDASGIARDMKPALERTNFAMIGNYSLA